MSNVKELKQFFQDKPVISAKLKVDSREKINDDDDDGTSSMSSFKQLINNNNIRNYDRSNNKVHQTIDHHQNDEFHKHFTRGFNYITGQIGALVTPSEHKSNTKSTSDLVYSTHGHHLSGNTQMETKQQKLKHPIISGNDADKSKDNQQIDEKDLYAKKKQSSFASLTSFLRRSTSKKNKRNKYKSKSFEHPLLNDYPISEEDTLHNSSLTRSNVSLNSLSIYSKSISSNTNKNASSEQLSPLTSEKETSNEISTHCTEFTDNHLTINSYESPIKVVNNTSDELFPEKTCRLKSIPTPKPRKSLEKNNLQTLDSKLRNYSSEQPHSSDPRVSMQQMIANEFVMLTKRQSLLHMFAQSNENNQKYVYQSLKDSKQRKELEDESEKQNECSEIPPPLPPRTPIKTTHQDYINWEVVSNLKHSLSKDDSTGRNEYYNELILPASQSSFDHHLIAYGLMSSSTSSSIDHSDSNDNSDSEEAIYETIMEESSTNLVHESYEEKADSIVYTKASDLPSSTLNVTSESTHRNQSTPNKVNYPLDTINRIWPSSSEVSSTLEDIAITPIRNSSPHHNCMSNLDNCVDCPYNKMDAFFDQYNYEKLKSNSSINVKGLFKIFKKREIMALKSGKKFGLTGMEVPLCAGIVKDDCSRKNKYDLKLKSDQVVLVLRIHGNPPGKYLAKSEKGRIGYVDLSNLRVESQSIKMILRVYGPKRCESVSFPVSEL